MLRALIFSLALLGSAAQAAPADDHKLIVRGDRLFIPVTVNGQTIEALLDSGAEATFVDDDFLRVLSLKPEGGDVVKGSGGEEKVRFAKGVNIHAAGTDLADQEVAVIDLDPLSARLIGIKIPMILGRNFFDAGRFEIDIEKGTIKRLADDAKPQGVELPLTTHRGIEDFPISIEGRDVHAALDLGNGSEMMVGREAAVKMRIALPSRIIERKQGGGIGGTVSRDIVLLSTITIAGKTFTKVRAAIDDQDSQSDANVGVNLLRHFIVTTDFPGHKLWLKPRG